MLHEAGHSRGQLHSDVLLLCMLECSRRQRFCVIIIIINIILLLLLFFIYIIIIIIIIVYLSVQLQSSAFR